MKQLTIFPLFLIIIALLIFSGCEEEKELESIQLDKNEITIHYDETHQLDVSYTPTDVEVQPALEWSSKDSNVAKVSSKGLVEGVKIGETDITVQTKDDKFQAACNVIIEPKSNLYKEPVIELGESKSYVKDNEAQELLGETEDGVVYDRDNDKVRFVAYLFDDNNKLSSTMVCLKDNPSEELETYLRERYEFIEKTTLEGNIVSLFEVNKDVIAVKSYHDDLKLNVMYMENTLNKSIVKKHKFLLKNLPSNLNLE